MNGGSQSDRRSRIGPAALAWAVTAAYAAIILTVNRLPQRSELVETVGNLPFGDKLGHLGEYGGLAFLLAAACGVGRRGRSAVVLLAGLSGFAALDEFTQPWWGRTCDVWDWTADTVAAGLGWAAARAWLALTTARRPPSAAG